MSGDTKNNYDDLGLNNEAFAFQDPDASVFKTKEGLDEDVVRQISGMTISTSFFIWSSILSLLSGWKPGSTREAWKSS